MQETPLSYSNAAINPTRVPSTATLGESRFSAVSWSSIIAGSVATLAVTGILVTLGGAAGIAPWNKGATDAGDAAKTMTAIAAVALVVTQWVASGVGGYLTGRLRTKWTGVHSHEVYFRDTAHGFLAWAIATIFTVMTLGSAISSAVGHDHGGMMGMQGGEGRAMHRGMTGGEAGDEGPMGYYIDQLYRPAVRAQQESAQPTAPPTAPTPTPDSVKLSGAAPQQGAPGSSPSVSVFVPPAPMPFLPAGPSGMPGSGENRAEIARVLTHASMQATVPPDDRDFLIGEVQLHAGLTVGDASTRVENVIARVKEDATQARKAAAYVALFTGLSMLIGAFIAAAAAAFGGSQRDEWENAVVNDSYVSR